MEQFSSKKLMGKIPSQRVSEELPRGISERNFEAISEEFLEKLCEKCSCIPREIQRKTSGRIIGGPPETISVILQENS